MQHRFRDRCTSETLTLLTVIALMGLFAAGLFYAGNTLRPPQRTAQLAVPNLNP